MELVLLITILASVATNLYLVKRVTTLSINVSAPIVNVTAPEPFVTLSPVLESSPAFELDYDRLEAMVEQLVANQNVTPIYPVQVPQYPTPPSPYWQTPIVSKDTNAIEIDGVKGKQFPAR